MENNKPWLIALTALVIIIVLGGLGLYISQTMQVKGLRNEMSSAISQLSAQIGELKTQPITEPVDQSTGANLSSGSVDALVASEVPSQTDKELLNFINPTGGYSFQYSKDWQAFINRYNATGSLFGPNASVSSGLGGVEVTVFAGDLNDWLRYYERNVEISFISNSFTKISGMDAVKATIKAGNRTASSVFIKNSGKIFNVYINSSNAQDLNKFNQIVNSFKFTK